MVTRQAGWTIGNRFRLRMTRGEEKSLERHLLRLQVQQKVLRPQAVLPPVHSQTCVQC